MIVINISYGFLMCQSIKLLKLSGVLTCQFLTRLKRSN